jgi:CPA2 family monovalent cation:H+ antiporter-2
LGLVVLAAAAAGWLCRRAGLPLILGYIAAGILIGPHVPFLAVIDDFGGIHAMAQIGLVFLVFQIGQGLQLQRLKSAGFSLVVATLILAVLVFNGSRLLAYALGWPAGYGWVLAGMLMASSTLVIGKTLRESNALHSTSGQVAMTVTALDDLLAVAMLALLTIIQASSSAASGAVVDTIMRLAAVMAAMLVIAIIAVPPLLKRLNRLGDEPRTLFIVGLLLAMALISSKTGFPAAIGAFLLGSVVASTGHKDAVQRSMGGLCEMLGALFFVAAGMLFDFKQLVGLWPVLLLVFAFGLVGRGLSSTMALLLVGQKTGVAVRTGVSLTPMGEFSIIIGLTAVQIGVTPDWFYSLAIGLCLLSALATPVLLRNSVGISSLIERRQPDVMRRAISFYHDLVERFHTGQRASLFWRLTGPRWLQIFIQILVISGLLVFSQPAHQLVEKWLSPDGPMSHGVTLVFWMLFIGVLLSPAIALWRMIEAVSMICAETAMKGYRYRTILQPAFEKLLRGAACVAVLVWLSMFVPFETFPKWGLIGVIAAGVLLAMLFWRNLVRWHSRFEIGLREHLRRAEKALPEADDGWQKHSDRWRLGVREHVVGEHTRPAGKTMRELPIRQLFSCTVVGIERHGFHISNPDPGTVLYPTDRVLLLGAENDLRQADQWLAAPGEHSGQNGNRGFDQLCLEQVAVPAASRHVGKSLGDLNLKGQLGIQVVGIERNGAGRLPAGKYDALSPGDRLLVLGTRKQIADIVLWLDTRA